MLQINGPVCVRICYNSLQTCMCDPNGSHPETKLFHPSANFQLGRARASCLLYGQITGRWTVYSGFDKKPPGSHLPYSFIMRSRTHEGTCRTCLVMVAGRIQILICTGHKAKPSFGFRDDVSSTEDKERGQQSRGMMLDYGGRE